MNVNAVELAATIRTITIDGRNLTPNLWAQVPERGLAISTADGTIDATLWGRVNLHPGCGSPAGHVHVAYTHQGDLYQAAVHTTQDHPPTHSVVGEYLFQRCVSEQLHGREVDYLTGQEHTEHGVQYVFRPSPEAKAAIVARDNLNTEQADLDKVRRDHERYGGAHKRITRAEEAAARAQATFDDALAALDATLTDIPPAEVLYDQFTTEARAEADRRAQADQARQRLLALPQLYILGGGS